MFVILGVYVEGSGIIHVDEGRITVTYLYVYTEFHWISLACKVIWAS